MVGRGPFFSVIPFLNKAFRTVNRQKRKIKYYILGPTKRALCLLCGDGNDLASLIENQVFITARLTIYGSIQNGATATKSSQLRNGLSDDATKPLSGLLLPAMTLQIMAFESGKINAAAA